MSCAEISGALRGRGLSKSATWAARENDGVVLVDGDDPETPEFWVGHSYTREQILAMLSLCDRRAAAAARMSDPRYIPTTEDAHAAPDVFVSGMQQYTITSSTRCAVCDLTLRVCRCARFTVPAPADRQ